MTRKRRITKSIHAFTPGSAGRGRFCPSPLVVCLLLHFTTTPAFAQLSLFPGDPWNPKGHTTGAVTGEYVHWPFSSEGSLGSITRVFHRLGRLDAGLTVHLNRGVSFGLRRGPIIVASPTDGRFVHDESASIPSNGYTIEVPLELHLSYDLRPFRAGLSTRLYDQSETNWTYQLAEYGKSSYTARPASTEKNRTDLIAAASVGYERNGFRVAIGAGSVTLAGWGEDSLSFSRTRPFVSVGWNMFGGFTSVDNNMEELGISYAVGYPLVPVGIDATTKISTTFKTGVSTFRHRSVEFGVAIPLLSNAEFVVGYKKVWSDFDALSRAKFDRWRGALSGLLDGDPMSGIEHSSVRLGFTVRLGADPDEISLRLVSTKLFHRDVYTAKRDFYAYNPLGSVSIHNAGEREAVCLISLDLPGEYGGYRSEPIRIEPDEVKTIPVHLFLADKPIGSPSTVVQMEVAVTQNGRRRVLSSLPITLFDAHSWDGDTWGLRYFMTPDEPSIQTNAKRWYIGSASPDPSLRQPERDFSRLRRFLTVLGKDLQYLQDPTTSMFVDRVQYPTETMRVASGDCEDLVVYVASHLMAVGIQCALVDLKPVPTGLRLPTAGERSIGHILLLANTGLQTEFASRLGLSEFEFVSRAVSGAPNTLWIPVETTVLNEGFEKAFREGVRQYYREVIERDGVRNGTVHVYDF